MGSFQQAGLILINPRLVHTKTSFVINFLHANVEFMFSGMLTSPVECVILSKKWGVFPYFTNKAGSESSGFLQQPGSGFWFCHLEAA